MPKGRTEWTVLPHEPLQKLAENLWWVRAPVPGIPMKRTMTIARLADQRLLIHNAIPLDEPSMREIEAWGTPSLLIVPNRGHRLDAPAYLKRYPELRVYGPRGGRKGIEEVIQLTGSYEDLPADPNLRLEYIAGINDEEGALLVTSNDGVSVVLNDAMFNMPLPAAFLGRMVVRLLGSAPGPKISRLVKLVFVKDKQAFRAHLERLAETPGLVRLIVAHDSVAHGADAAAALRSAASQL